MSLANKFKTIFNDIKKDIERIDNKTIYVPQKGIDYWTDDDKEEIRASITQATYTNQLPISTDTDETVFNSVGYKVGYRINSSGSIVEHSARVVTGFIPVTKGDVIYCKNLKWRNVNDEIYLCTFGADKSFKYALNGTSAQATIDEENKLVTFNTSKFGDFSSSTAYVRFCFYSNDTSWDYTKGIITVNEEITDTYDSRITACEERLLANEESIAEMDDARSVPSYIQTEGKRVADLLLNLRNSKSICFVALSDTHVGVGDDTKSAVIDTGKAIREIRKYLPLDFIGLFGDYVAGGSSSTISGSKEELKFVHKSLYEAGLGVQQIWMQGNHDRNPYDTDDGDLTDEELYSYIFANNSGTVIDKNNVQRGYGYKDFENQKIRVVYWNTSDISEAETLSDHMISASQYEWMGNVAFNLSDKEDAQEWGIIMLSHMPVNWSVQLTNFVDAYISGESVTVIAADNTNVTVNFSDKNQAEFICAINGHTHNYRYSQIGTNNFWQIAVPQVCAGRYNEYGTSYPEVGGELDSNGNPVYYYKTTGTEKSTSFIVFVIDRKNKQIQAIHYGAGIDRVIKYGDDAESETPETPTYTNVVPLSECVDSTEVYNGGLGYKDGYYISSSNGNEATKTGHVVTGMIPYKVNSGSTPPPTIYIKGGAVDRIGAYLEDKSFKSIVYSGLTNTELGVNYYVYTPEIGDTGNCKLYENYGNIRYLRFDIIMNDGADLIITLDEPIE